MKKLFLILGAITCILSIYANFIGSDRADFFLILGMLSLIYGEVLK